MKEGNMTQDFNERIIQYLTGSASVEDKREVEQWLDENPDHMKYFSELQDIYHLTMINRQPSGFNRQAGWDRIKAGYFEKRYLATIEESKIRTRRTAWRIAASLAAVLILGLIIDRMFLPEPGRRIPVDQVVYNEVIAPIGSKISQAILSDGTQVWLNAGSKLRYPASFSGGERQVYLEGEAFFDVTKGDDLFVVKTSDVDIKVYGTRFNVKSYPEEDLIETTLVEGSLSVESSRETNGHETVMVEPNQKVTFFKSDQHIAASSNDLTGTPDPKEEPVRMKSGEIIITQEIDPQSITSWKDEEWVFNRETLGELAVKLERRYDVKIDFETESLKAYCFTGIFQDETFEQILDILQLGAPVAYSIEKNHVTLKEDPTFKLRYDDMISYPTN